MTEAGYAFKYTFQGVQLAVLVPGIDPSLEEIGKGIQLETGLSYSSLKLLGPGLKGALTLLENGKKKASEAGLLSDRRYMVLGSPQGEIDAVRKARDLPGLMGFDAEAKRAASRRRNKMLNVTKPPGGKYTFGDYKVLEIPGAYPAPSEAMKILYRLASDPGIIGIMNDRRWQVGLLSEMPPEGKVGISEKCVLGYNVNKGQEIALRLRTDDLKGLRKYRSVRDTLLHELTHNVWSDHDNNFKALNSELSHQCEHFLSQSMGGVLLGGDGALGPQSSEEMDIDPEPIPHTVGGNASALDPRKAASFAALQRLSGNPSVIGNVVDIKSDSKAVELESLAQVKEMDGERHAGGGAGQRFGKQPGVSNSDVLPVQSVDQDLMETTPVGRLDGQEEVQEDQPGPSGLGSNGVNEGRQSDMPAAGSGRRDPETRPPQKRVREPIPDLQAPGLFPMADPAMQRACQVEKAVDSLISASGGEALKALETAQKIFKNALQNPGAEKFRSIRVNNQTFHNRLGRYRDALDLMKLMGFVEEGEPLDPVLKLRRCDPGLIWLGLSMVNDGIDKLD